MSHGLLQNRYVLGTDESRRIFLDLLSNHDEIRFSVIAEQILLIGFTPEELRGPILSFSKSKWFSWKAIAAELIGIMEISDLEDVLVELALHDYLVIRQEACKSLFKLNPERLREVLAIE